jgi:hypothetical protein
MMMMVYMTMQNIHVKMMTWVMDVSYPLENLVVLLLLPHVVRRYYCYFDVDHHQQHLH